MDKKMRRARRLKSAAKIGRKIANKEIPTVKFNRVFDEEKGKAVLKPELSEKSINVKPPKSETLKRLENKAKAKGRQYIDEQLAENEEDNLGTEALRKGINTTEDVSSSIKKALPSKSVIERKAREEFNRAKNKYLKERRWRDYKKETEQFVKNGIEKTGKKAAKEAAKKTGEKAGKSATAETLKKSGGVVVKEAAIEEGKREFRHILFKKARQTAAKEAAKKAGEVAVLKAGTDAAVATTTTTTAVNVAGIATGVEEVLMIITAVIVLIIMLAIFIALIASAIFFHSFYTSQVAGAMYQSESRDIEEAELHMSYLEASLVEYIEEIEDKEPDYDGYVVEGSYSVGHNPFTLINYLSAKFPEFTYSDVEDEIDDLFNTRYTIQTWVEEKEVIIEDDDDEDEDEDDSDDEDEDDDDDEDDDEPETETLYIFHVRLITNYSLETIVESRMNDDEKEQYEIFGETKGGLQFVASPIGGNYYGNISSYYGYRYHPISNNLSFHRGLDIAIPEGTSLIAGIDGTVTTVGNDPDGYGNYVVIENDEGIKVKYAHMKAIYVANGDTVKSGITVLGESGNTGASTGPHVHVEILENGEYLNPLFYLDTE